MFIRKKLLYGKKIAVQICENHRENGKVRQSVLRHVGTVENQDKENLQKLLEAAEFLRSELENKKIKKALELQPEFPIEIPGTSPIVATTSSEEIPSSHDETPVIINSSKLVEETRIVEGLHAVFGTVLDQFGLQAIIGQRHYNLLRDLIMSRIAWPSSKLKASEHLQKRFNIDVSVDRIYRLMDALEDQEEILHKAMSSVFKPLIGEKVEVLFFDVTTLYFESTKEDELRRFGFSKDQKTHMTQVVLALATNKDGLPFGYKLFPGNTAETSTLLQAVEEWRKIFCIEQITIIADRAMMNEKNIKALEDAKIKYIIASKLKKLPTMLQKTILARSNEKIVFQNEEDTISVQEYIQDNRRLIVSYSEQRKKKDEHDREQILTKLRKKLGAEASTRKLVTNRGYLSMITENGNSRVRIDEEKVSLASQWDGLHGVLTNIDNLSSQEVLALYRRLWVIEESFRINKNTLEMRPIYHYASRRIQTHIFICYIAFALCRYTQKRIAMQYENLSVDRIRSILIEVQASILKDEETQCRYVLPSKMSLEANKIYSIFNIKRNRRMSKM
jgi:transposase